MKKYSRRSVAVIMILFIFSGSISFSRAATGKNAIYYNNEGWEYLAKGDYFRAIISFKNALKLNRKYKQSILGLGKAYIKTEAYEESLELFSDVLKIDDKDIDAIIGAASAMTELGQYNNALKYLDTALQVDEENTEAKYGIAYIYYLMDKIIWAKRRLNSILMINPYHYQSLLLMADIKIREKRDNEARDYIQKAIDADIERPDAYIKYGQILLRDYKLSQNTEYMAEAAEKFNRALSINPENLTANRSMGNLFLLQKNYDEALKYFQKTLGDYPENPISLYNTAVAYAGLNDQENTINYLLKAMAKSPSDSMIISRLEDYLVLNDFAIGHPLRVRFSGDHYKIAVNKLKTNLPDDAVMHLRRSLLLNPLNRQARESLRDIYQILNYYRFYIDEQKTLYNLFPEDKYQDMLRIAVIRRRDRLYHRAGYSSELPPRDIPKILVLNLSPIEPFSPHPDAGQVIANYITFAFSEFGRMEPVGIQKRMEICKSLKDDRQYIGDNLEILSDMIREGKAEEPDYLIFGTYREGSNYTTIDFELLDFHNGVIINNFPISESGKENLPDLSIRASKKLFEAITFKGRILRADENGIIVNMGLIDGIKPGDFLTIYKLEYPDSDDLKLKKKIMLEVMEADTMISSAKPKIAKDMEYIDINDAVYPYKKRTAKLIK